MTFKPFVTSAEIVSCTEIFPMCFPLEAYYITTMTTGDTSYPQCTFSSLACLCMLGHSGFYSPRGPLQSGPPSFALTWNAGGRTWILTLEPIIKVYSMKVEVCCGIWFPPSGTDREVPHTVFTNGIDLHFYSRGKVVVFFKQVVKVLFEFPPFICVVISDEWGLHSGSVRNPITLRKAYWPNSQCKHSVGGCSPVAYIYCSLFFQ